MKLVTFTFSLLIISTGSYLNFCDNNVKLSFYDIAKERISSHLPRKNVVPYGGILGIVSSNIFAYSNGNDSFYSNETYSINGTFMGMKWQCVEFARRWTFLRKGCVFQTIEGAQDIWTRVQFVERVSDGKHLPIKHHANGSPNKPTNESYLIYSKQKDMPYGHVAVIVDVLDDRIRIAEQNYEFIHWSHNYSREISWKIKNDLYFLEDHYNILGWIEII